MTVHVSLHDVSPAWGPELELALEYADAVGAKPALLVVPNFHGAWPLGDHPAFCARLRELQARGHEVYLHGFFHESRTTGAADATATAEGEGEGKPRGLRRWYAQKVVSAGEAEFSDVTKDEARERLDAGERVLRDAGLRIDGFIAPAWSMPPWVLAMLAERGYGFSEDHGKIYDPAGHRSKASVVLNYASRTPARLLSSVAWCRIAKLGRLAFPARLAIHPADMRYALLRDEVRSMLAWAEPDLVARGQDLF
jgi:predicted deacetylase